MTAFASEQQIIDAIGLETESEYENELIDDGEFAKFDDVEYRINEDYRTNFFAEESQPEIPQQRTNRIPFIDQSDLFDFNLFNSNITRSKTNLPNSFDSSSTPIQYFSLYFIHGMMKDIRNTMNQRYNAHLDNMNFSDLLNAGNRSIDPLTGSIDDDTNGRDTIAETFQASRITIQNVYQFIGSQLVMGCVDLPSESNYFTGTQLIPAIIHQLPQSLFVKMKKLFKIPLLSRQDNLNESKKYLSVDQFSRDDSCAKVCWYLFHLNRNFQKYIVIGDVIAIDESMSNCQNANTQY